MNDLSERVPAKDCNGPYEVNRKGEVFNAKTGKKIKIYPVGGGYLCFQDCCNGVRKGRGIHRIMLLSFDIPNPYNKPTVNHKNGIRTDNRLENLEWHTHKEQTAHARDVLGRTIGRPKGTPKQEGSGKPPRQVRATHLKTGEQREFESISEAARQVGGNIGHICTACRGNRKSSAGYRWEYLN